MGSINQPELGLGFELRKIHTRNLERPLPRLMNSDISLTLDLEQTMKEKVVLITGANSGIGKETALGLAKMGASLVLVCRDRKKGEAAKEEIARTTEEASIELLARAGRGEGDAHGNPPRLPQGPSRHESRRLPGSNSTILCQVGVDDASAYQEAAGTCRPGRVKVSDSGDRL